MIERAKVICNSTISSIYNTHVWRGRTRGKWGVGLGQAKVGLEQARVGLEQAGVGLEQAGIGQGSDWGLD